MKRIKKAILLLMISVFMLTCGCKKGSTVAGVINAYEEHPTAQTMTYEYEEQMLSKSDVINSSTNIVLGTYIGIEEGFGQNEFLFSVNDTLRGESDEEIYIEIQDLSENLFKGGHQYYLFLTKHISVYHSHEHYVINCWYSYDDPQVSELKQMIALSSVIPTPIGLPFTASENLIDILSVSPTILVVEVGKTMLRGTYAPTEIHDCQIRQLLRGSQIFSNVKINFFQNTVSEGEIYVVLLAQDGETTPYYTLSSRNSVYTVEQAKEIPQLNELIENAGIYSGIPAFTDEEILAQEQQAMTGEK